jgi:hypothetical protein
VIKELDSVISSTVIGWTFLSNHAHVLVFIAQNPEARLRDIAAGVHITERTTQRIINQLREANVLSMEKIGRRNRYTINLDSCGTQWKPMPRSVIFYPISWISVTLPESEKLT